MDNELYDDLFMGQWSRNAAMPLDEAFFQEEEHRRVYNLFSTRVGTLTELDRTIFRHAFLKHAEHVMSGLEIAACFGVSLAQVHRHRDQMRHNIWHLYSALEDETYVADHFIRTHLTQEQLTRLIGPRKVRFSWR